MNEHLNLSVLETEITSREHFGKMLGYEHWHRRLGHTWWWNSRIFTLCKWDVSACQKDLRKAEKCAICVIKWGKSTLENFIILPSISISISVIVLVYWLKQINVDSLSSLVTSSEGYDHALVFVVAIPDSNGCMLWKQRMLCWNLPESDEELVQWHCRTPKKQDGCDNGG